MYDFIPECIDLSEALGSSGFCTVISCADSFLRPQSFCFANSHFSPSHITTSVYRHDFSEQTLVELNTLRCRMLLVSSRTKKKKKKFTDLFLSLPSPQGQVKALSHTRCVLMFHLSYYLNSWFTYTCIRQTSLFATCWFFSSLCYEHCILKVVCQVKCSSTFKKASPCILFHFSLRPAVFESKHTLCEQPLRLLLPVVCSEGRKVVLGGQSQNNL